MIFYVTLFFAFVYFKIARVHKKEERMSSLVLLQHFVVGICAVVLLYYGVLYVSWYFFMLSVLLFVIAASLMITVIQLGIFVDGKPMFGLSSAYKYLPLLTLVILFLSIVLWVNKIVVI
ncbi:hypothetical protein KKA17_04900 [bacterium]|nr:hypothetical protein [bacterium]MBU1884265.1 hypothetical protein [bacterium]